MGVDARILFEQIGSLEVSILCTTIAGLLLDGLLITLLLLWVFKLLDKHKVD